MAQTILKHIIFQRGVPRTLRTDNAPELSSLTGAGVSAICEYLKIDQIRTGGHNPRGNSICERVNQCIGSMIRKLTDQEYKQLKSIALPAFQFALNTTFNSAIVSTDKAKILCFDKSNRTFNLSKIHTLIHKSNRTIDKLNRTI